MTKSLLSCSFHHSILWYWLNIPKSSMLITRLDKRYLISKVQNQSWKPKSWLSTLGSFFVPYVMFSKMCLYESNNDVIKYYGSVIPEWLRYGLWKIQRATSGGSFLRKLTSKAGTNWFFKVWTPISSVKCLIQLDVKFYWAQSVQGIYNRMEQIPIGEQ